MKIDTCKIDSATLRLEVPEEKKTIGQNSQQIKVAIVEVHNFMDQHIFSRDEH